MPYHGMHNANAELESRDKGQNVLGAVLAELAADCLEIMLSSSHDCCRQE